MKVFWTKEAQLSLENIEEYISKDNTISAIEFVDELISVGEPLSKYPERGRIIPELAIENIREIIPGNYRIVFLIKSKSIDILTVFEGHKLLRKEDYLKSS